MVADDPLDCPPTPPSALTREQVVGICLDFYGDLPTVEQRNAIVQLRDSDKALRQALAQQAQEIESARELNRIAAVALSEKEQEVERLEKDAEGQAVRIDALRKHLASAITEHHNAEIKLAALQSTLAEREARTKELEEWQKIVIGSGTDQETVIRMAANEYTKSAVQCWKEHTKKIEAERDTARQDAARLREAALWAMKKVKRLSTRSVDYKRADDFIQHEEALKGA